MEPVEPTLDEKIAAINAKWLENQMADYGLRQADISRECGINKTSLSLFLSDQKDLPKGSKMTLHYYFLYLSLKDQIMFMGDRNELEL